MISKSLIVIIYGPSLDTPSLVTSYLNSSALFEPWIVWSELPDISMMLYFETTAASDLVNKFTVLVPDPMDTLNRSMNFS